MIPSLQTLGGFTKGFYLFELALLFLNWEVMDTGKTSFHQSIFVKFPHFIAISSKPLPSIGAFKNYKSSLLKIDWA